MVKLTDMTLADLKVLIAQVVEEQLQGWQNRPLDDRSAETGVGGNGSVTVVSPRSVRPLQLNCCGKIENR